MASAGSDEAKSDKLAALVTQAADAPPADPPNTRPADVRYVEEDDDETDACGCRCSLFRRPKQKVKTPLQNGKKPPPAPAQIKATSVVPSPGNQRSTTATQSARGGGERAQATRTSESSRSRGSAAPAQRGGEEGEHGQLGPQVGKDIGRKTLVLDLDETLVHSSFRRVDEAEIVITVELEGEHHKVYVRKRPGVDEFLRAVADCFEVVIYTASMSKYANPLMDVLDPQGYCTSRLFREACTKHDQGGYMKDLSKLGRNLKDVIIIDNSPICYALQPHNAIPIKTWRNDYSDQELLELIPILNALVTVEDIPAVLRRVVWSLEE
mmetsp:Transcript_30570/g.90694  ORF Transcript_30570/g.90694 Transcript_30570/m.90694 type:complete len:324 (-) Transcript_30570:42-1013(-)